MSGRPRGAARFGLPSLLVGDRVDLRDAEGSTRDVGHSERVGESSRRISREVGCDVAQRDVERVEVNRKTCDRSRSRIETLVPPFTTAVRSGSPSTLIVKSVSSSTFTPWVREMPPLCLISPSNELSARRPPVIGNEKSPAGVRDAWGDRGGDDAGANKERDSTRIGGHVGAASQRPDRPSRAGSSQPRARVADPSRMLWSSGSCRGPWRRRRSATGRRGSR